MFHRIGVLAALLVASPGAALAQITFEDLSSRIPFVHRSQDIGGNGLGGAVWFDYDRDGQIDLFLGNGPVCRTPSTATTGMEPSPTSPSRRVSRAASAPPARWPETWTTTATRSWSRWETAASFLPLRR